MEGKGDATLDEADNGLGAVPIVTTQITRAAARLAAWLNAISAELAERVDL